MTSTPSPSDHFGKGFIDQEADPLAGAIGEDDVDTNFLVGSWGWSDDCSALDRILFWGRTWWCEASGRVQCKGRKNCNFC